MYFKRTLLRTDLAKWKNYLFFSHTISLFYFFEFKDKKEIMEEHQRQLADREVCLT